MSPLKLAKTFIVTSILLHANLQALSKNVSSADLSLQPKTGCKSPPKKFSSIIQKKAYKTYYPAGEWQVFDINGDGWCDRIRGGYEGHRKDQELPPMHEFIYLGKKSGWLSFINFYSYKISIGKIKAENIDGYVTGDSWAAGFFEPIAIYADDEPIPYVATVFRPDGPAPPPDREKIFVYQWDSNAGMLHSVDSAKKLLIVNFFRTNACGDNPKIKFDGYPTMLSAGSLCK